MTTLRDYMDRNGLTQAQMAEMLGVRQPSVGRYLKGQVPDPVIMQKIIDATEGQVTADSFFIIPPKRKRKL